jgi:hypothetical protein
VVWSDMLTSCSIQKKNEERSFAPLKMTTKETAMLKLGAHAAYYVVYCDGADWMIVAVYDGQAP